MGHPVGVISPHLDDGVLSCTHLLRARPGSVVVTVFDGGPPTVDPVTTWDVASGFAGGDDVTGVRRAEDARALADLGATGLHLGFWDHQYRTPTYGYDDFGEPVLEEAVIDAIDAVVGDRGLTTWLVPLGIEHPDHQMTHRAARQVAARRGTLDWVIYEELPYYDRFPEDRGRAVADLEAHGMRIERADVSLGAEDGEPDAAVKERAIRRYPTQCLALGADLVAVSIHRPERYHVLVTEGP